LVPAEVQQRVQERLERRRWRRMVDGWHPVIDVAVASRTSREGPTAWLREDAQSLAIIHPAAGEVNAGWIREAGRVVGALGTRMLFGGFVDGDALVVVANGTATELAALLLDLHLGTGAWQAGVTARTAATTTWV